MIKNQTNPKKQLSIEEYFKTKEKRANDKLKLQFPLFVKILIVLPVVFTLISILIFLLKIRHIPEH